MKHVKDLRKMMAGKAGKVTASAIRGTDVPTEYIIIFAFLFIALIGILVGVQVKRAGSASLPMTSKTRAD